MIPKENTGPMNCQASIIGLFLFIKSAICHEGKERKERPVRLPGGFDAPVPYWEFLFREQGKIKDDSSG
jgi:hypothetical protein